ncbi:unnamed protein product [Didymodactylos carnosus]|uniref:Uncharacterized protein n=1 Tax=Didymodactylos carnosus TaxID=1234261 RepID=A0A814KMZ2_9BILA|nr:unnamed protein product [Didymodactylos carnosus]CAF3821269.1 unnamed protein product [Didymodactylos carnosus]
MCLPLKFVQKRDHSTTTSNLFHNHVHSTLNTTRLHESNDIDCSVFSYVNSSVPLKELDQKLEIIGTGQETQCIANEKDSSYLTTIQNYSCPDNINDKSILSDYQSKTKQVNICVSKGVVKCSDITDNNDIMVQEPNSKFLLVLCNEKSATTTAPSIHSSNAYGSTSAKNFSISLSSPPLQTDTCQLAPSSSSLDKQTQQLDKRKKYPLIDIIYSNEEEQLMTSQILHKTLDMNHVLVSTTTSSSSKTFLNRSQELLLTKPLLKRSCASYLIEHSNHIFGTKNYEEQNDDEFFITAGCVLHSCPNIYTSVLGDNEFIRQRSKSCEISCIEYLSDDKSAFVPNSYDTCSNKYTFTPRFQSKQKNDYDSTDSINSEIEDYCIRHQNGFHCSSMVDDNLFPSTWRSDEHLLQIPFYDDSPSVIRSRSYDIQINRRSVLV